MTLQECTFALTGLAFEFGQALDETAYRAYHRALGGIHYGVFTEACRQVALTPRGQYMARFPPPVELRVAAEKARRQMLALVPYDGCSDCEHSKGWRTVIGKDGRDAVEVCPCRARHREMLADRGLNLAIVPLEGEQTRENEPVYPTADQLPAPIRQRLEGITKQKVLR